MACSSTTIEGRHDGRPSFGTIREKGVQISYQLQFDQQINLIKCCRNSPGEQGGRRAGRYFRSAKTETVPDLERMFSQDPRASAGTGPATQIHFGFGGPSADKICSLKYGRSTS